MLFALCFLDLFLMQIFGVIAYPVNHSLSPVIHSAALKHLHLNATYKAFDVEPEKLDLFFSKVKEKKLCLSVSIPYKEKVQKYCGEISVAAKRIGAVNTIYWREGKMIGHNTDFIGIRKPLQKVIDLEDKKVTILGAGGTARAAAYACVLAGAQVTILNRTVEKAAKIAQIFKCKYNSLDNYDKNTDLIIQTTSVGLMSDESLLTKEDFSENMVVFDVIYRPQKTQFLKNAEEAGATIITGDQMFLVQACEQFKLFTGKVAPTEVMEKAFLEAVNDF